MRVGKPATAQAQSDAPPPELFGGGLAFGSFGSGSEVIGKVRDGHVNHVW